MWIFLPPATFTGMKKPYIEIKERVGRCMCYIFLVKSDKTSLRIRLVGLGSQIKELKID